MVPYLWWNATEIVLDNLGEVLLLAFRDQVPLQLLSGQRVEKKPEMVSFCC